MRRDATAPTALQLTLAPLLAAPRQCANLSAAAAPSPPLQIAAVGDIAAPYTLPCLFALVLLPNLRRAERALLKVLVPVSALLAAFGLYASCYRLVEVLGSR